MFLFGTQTTVSFETAGPRKNRLTRRLVERTIEPSVLILKRRGKAGAKTNDVVGRRSCELVITVVAEHQQYA